MPFVKLVKNKAYYKRYQVKYRRRREGKTDYYARKRLVVQDKNKYCSPRYRLVVRVTNHYVIAQIVFSELNGDRVVAAAYSSELPRYGIKAGLKNYAAAYATGLLVARRALSVIKPELKLADKYKGVSKVTGEVVTSEFTNAAGRTRNYWVKEVAEEAKPFRAVLDVGVRATTTGARLFGVMKGASDGGLDIPHNEKRFPGYNRESKEYNAAKHRERILGLHVAGYMQQVKEEDPELYKTRFSKFVAAGVAPEAVEAMYTKAHEAIRKDPSAAAKKAYKPDMKFKKPAKLTLAQRSERVAAKKAARIATLQAARKTAMAVEDDE